MSACNIVANNIRIIIILFFGRFHLQINKTSITTLYLYAFLFTLPAWLFDVTFTADRSYTLVGCDCVPGNWGNLFAEWGVEFFLLRVKNVCF